MTDETTTTEISNPWFIEEGIPGSGNRPTWLADKFKTVADLAKAHGELEKRLGVAPEEYDLSKSRYLDPDYAPFQELKQVAKEKRVPQEVMDKMIDTVDRYMDEFKIDYEEERKKLGENAPERLKILDNWAKANLSQEAYEGLSGSINNAAAVKAFEEIRGKFMSASPQIPSGNENSTSITTVADLQKELSSNLEKYSKDESYRKEYQKRLEVAVKNTPGYVDKHQS